MCGGREDEREEEDEDANAFGLPLLAVLDEEAELERV